MSRPLLVIATRNPGKIREIEYLLGDVPIAMRDLMACAGVPDVAEDGATYAANARAKASALARFICLPALADDSGLEVDALDGAPGIRSARFAGDDSTDSANIARLLARLHQVPDPLRTARFRCVIVVAHSDGRELMAEGTCEGMIARAPRGHGGFGYDPVFYCPPARATFAELSAGDKHRVSHRAAACRQLAPKLLSFLVAGV